MSIYDLTLISLRLKGLNLVCDIFYEIKWARCSSKRVLGNGIDWNSPARKFTDLQFIERIILMNLFKDQKSFMLLVVPARQRHWSLDDFSETKIPYKTLVTNIFTLSKKKNCFLIHLFRFFFCILFTFLVPTLICVFHVTLEFETPNQIIR